MRLIGRSLLYTLCSHFSPLPVVQPRRDFFYEDQRLPITIETSDRISHQFVSHILKILIDEVLGYDVEVVHTPVYNDMSVSSILNRLAGCSGQQ